MTIPSDQNNPNETPKAPKTKAVAIGSRDGASDPAITATGSGYVAEKILEIAFSEGIKVRRDKGLTDILSAFDVESPVPLEALGAVSAILDYVYRANQRQEVKMKYGKPYSMAEASAGSASPSGDNQVPTTYQRREDV